jgi:beta-lactam-binding protein with PASTA domain
VPKLLGKQLKVARKSLTGGRCKLGKVTGRRGNSVKVVKQNPKPGTVRTPGSTVSVKLG